MKTLPFQLGYNFHYIPAQPGYNFHYIMAQLGFSGFIFTKSWLSQGLSNEARFSLDIVQIIQSSKGWGIHYNVKYPY